LAGSAEAEAALGRERTQTAEARLQVDALNRQIGSLRDELARLNAVLEASEAKSREQNVQIVDLGKRLNAALASKVEELARYRSEFFGRLREVLGDRPDIRVVGDRFVFQSEVLFQSGSADLQEGGRAQITQLARTLAEVAAKIPPDISWVLRVDGHTDRVPIATARFPSNWELSTARAVAVVKQLTERGIPSARLAATGFGEFQPLDAREDAGAYQRNRRIEFKLTER
jgi:chemotaxis protein MotB